MLDEALSFAPEMVACGDDGVSAGLVFGLFFGDAPSAGMCARRRSHFLCLAKESNQRKATPLAATLRCASGNLRCSRPGCAAELTARLQRFVQTAAASQSTKRMHPAVHSRTPPAALLGASRGEGETARAIAALGLGLIGATAARGGDLLPLARAGRGRGEGAFSPPPLGRAGVGATPSPSPPPPAPIPAFPQRGKEQYPQPTTAHAHCLNQRPSAATARARTPPHLWPCREAQGVGRAQRSMRFVL